MIYREREEDVAHTASPYSRSAISGSAIDAKLIEDPDLERSLYGSWNRGRGMKSNGLMKKVLATIIAFDSSANLAFRLSHSQLTALYTI